MDTRRKPEQSSMEKIGSRVRQRALTGTEASAVGFTLVVYIFAGAGLGYLLDRNLETSYWIAIGMLVGTAIGFREMFRLTKKLTRKSALDDDDEAAETRREYSASEPGIVPHMRTAAEEPAAPEAQQGNRPRIFSVPPPPQASFEQQRANEPASPEPVESQEELIERLLDDEKNEGSAGDESANGEDAKQTK